MDLKDKAALVIGGARGIGHAIALALAEEGCRIVVADCNAEKLQQTAADFNGQPLLLTKTSDITNREDVKALVAWTEEQLGGLDIAVNSAGVNVIKRKMCELDPADFDRIMAVNCTGFFNVLHAVLPGMRKRKGGLIVSICSIAGKRAVELTGPAYSASKFAVNALATAVGNEERPNGIRITSIHPGEVNTELLDQRPEPVPEERKVKMIQPENIGACVVTLAKLPPNVVVPELIIKPLYMEYT